MRPLPELSLLQSFVTVAQELNFRRSAERLALDQSALSRRIQKLESVLGYRLLERTTREVMLTPAGRLFYRRAGEILASTAQSVSEARSVAEGRTGRVRVAYMAFAATELMPRTVSRFGARHPDIALELQYMRTQGQKLALANDEIDVGFMIGPYDNSECRTELLASDLLYAVMPRGHPLLRQHQLHPVDLAGQPLILGDMAQWGEFRYRLEDLFSQVGMPLQPRLEASNTLALIGLVAAGLGVTIYPESLIGFLGRNVETRPIVHPDFRSRTILAWKRSNRSRAVLDFIAIAMQRGLG
ncbi:Transcriptional regulator, LysR family protein [Oceanicola granulosus HTCC2516]|uniref:Transcriptional regulator, LysR family protein n=1 Tax=Oceanicola granulosus (strain ATCC BAA-861 / DSM 15982 / KCTC 12143 / HTCC2516) TaxID=314256 RepID=Q2CH49_OCEGH|nr:LysR substrate-binding domain-containing protein [Oceanicola granulosus]EAR51962.1 Transcriptional regulator, LysR family protein [Oceanicola granulosus HTCC2516]